MSNISYELNYIKHMNSIGHNFLKIDWNEDITSAFTSRKITNNVKTLSIESIKNACENKVFQKTFNIYFCNLCSVKFLINVFAPYDIQLLINNIIHANDMLHTNYIKPTSEIEDEPDSFGLLVKKDVFKLNCNELLIKALLE